MRVRLSGTSVPVLVLALTFLSASWSTVWAGGLQHAEKRARWASEGYAVPIQQVDQFPAAIVWQPPTPPFYAVPIQQVDQFPAAIIWQPSPSPPIARPLRPHGSYMSGPYGLGF